MEFAMDNRGPQRMNPNELDDLLSFSLAVPSDQPAIHYLDNRP